MAHQESGNIDEMIDGCQFAVEVDNIFCHDVQKRSGSLVRFAGMD